MEPSARRPRCASRGPCRRAEDRAGPRVGGEGTKGFASAGVAGVAGRPRCLRLLPGFVTGCTRAPPPAHGAGAPLVRCPPPFPGGSGFPRPPPIPPYPPLLPNTPDLFRTPRIPSQHLEVHPTLPDPSPTPPFLPSDLPAAAWTPPNTQQPSRQPGFLPYIWYLSPPTLPPIPAQYHPLSPPTFPRGSRNPLPRGFPASSARPRHPHPFPRGTGWPGGSSPRSPCGWAG